METAFAELYARQNFQCVSFIGFILLTKSLSCNVAVLIRIQYYCRIFKYSEIISLIWKGPYYDKFQCHKLREGNFRGLGRFCEVSNSPKVGSLVPVQTVQRSVRTPSCVKKILTAQLASVRTTGHHRLDALQCSRRIQISFADTDWERQLATIRTLGQHHPDAALIRKRVKHVMERQLHSPPSECSMPPSKRCLENSKLVAI